MIRRMHLIVVCAALIAGWAVIRADPAAGGDASGSRVFSQNCAVCHGQDGKGTTVAPGLTAIKDRQFILQRVKDGAGIMPSFDNKLSPEQIRAVADYVAATIAKH